MNAVSDAALRDAQSDGAAQQAYDQLFTVRELLLADARHSPAVSTAIDHIRLARQELRREGAR